MQTQPASTATAHAQRHARGFTLIEVMITMAIVAILVRLALPSYRDYILRGQLSDAPTALASFRANMERYYQDNRTYVGATVCATDNTTSQNFNFTCVAAANTYTLTMTGKNPMAGFAYTIDQSGAKTSTIVAPAPSGWIASSTNCWISKKGGTC